MSIRALRLDSDSSLRTLYRGAFSDAPREELVAIKAKGVRALFVVPESHLGAFLPLRDILLHCEKRPNRSLKQVCLGQTRIPLVTGRYTDSGQFLRSVRTLLQNAEDANDRNVFVIVAADAMFAEHWEHALPDVPADDASSRFDATALTNGVMVATSDSVQELMHLLPKLDVPKAVQERYIGDSPEIHLVRFLIVRAAQNLDTVLILGDTGTGKDVVAQLIHELGVNRPGLFVAVNCGAFPGELLELELFGYVKDSHSRAVRDKDGLWVAAKGGTLFLDEVADLSLEHQVKILRALDTHEIRPIGSLKTVQVDARILAATNRDLPALVRSGRFREDLYYRLRATMIRTPSLREHPQDIPKLAANFWKRATHDDSSVLAAEVVEFLRRRDWSGNVRELSLRLTSVYNLFGKQGIRVEHVKAVLDQDKQVPRANDALLELGDTRVHSLQCMRHLRQAIDVVRAAQVPLRDVMKGRSRVPATFEAIALATEDRVNELEMLCLHPWGFHTTPTFEVTRRFKEKLRDFTERMRREPDAALAFWKKELEPDSAYVLTVLMEELDQLMREG